MKCQKCGAELNNGVEFCPNCGTKVANDNEISNNTNQIQSEQNINNIQNNNESSQLTDNSYTPTLNNQNNNISNQEQTDNNIPNNKPKKKKTYWWITILLFSSFFIGTIITLVINMYIDGNDIQYSNKSLYDLLIEIRTIVNFLHISLPILAVLSIPVIIILNNKSTPEDEEEFNNLIYDPNTNIDEKLLASYVGKSYTKIIQKKFSWSAMFFSSWYLAFRKLYVQSIVVSVSVNVVNRILQLISTQNKMLGSLTETIITISIVFMVGKNFNKMYIDYSKKQIEKIKQQNTNAPENELIHLCEKAGGTNVWLMIAIMLLVSIISSTITSFIGK